MKIYCARSELPIKMTNGLTFFFLLAAANTGLDALLRAIALWLFRIE